MSQNIEPENTTNSNDATISEEINASSHAAGGQSANNNGGDGPQIETDETLETFTSWDSLGISTELLRGIFSYGFEQPSPIQQKAIKPIMNGRDIVAQAQSGTGKTATFSIGALSRVNTKDNSNQILIMSPTHELTNQISGVVSSLGNLIPGLRVKTVIGGSSIDNDVDEMHKTPPHVIVGTPGRVYDMMRRRHINAKKLKLVILDEADEMLSSGFKDQVYNIFQYLHKDVQIALFSATLPPEVLPITDKIMRNPVRITVLAEKLTLDGIRQFYVALDDDRQKYDTLKDLYNGITFSQCIIYCNSKERVQDLYEAMLQDQFPVCCIHSNMDKSERAKAFAEFRTGNARVLISSNVTARGIDIQQVSVVVNFDIPRDKSTYIHRIGRSGRWGRKGIGINFVTRRDSMNLRAIQDYYRCQINELPADLARLI
jgi:superfamily II DNA/RNA helicase